MSTIYSLAEILIRQDLETNPNQPIVLDMIVMALSDTYYILLNIIYYCTGLVFAQKGCNYKIYEQKNAQNECIVQILDKVK